MRPVPLSNGRLHSAVDAAGAVVVVVVVAGVVVVVVVVDMVVVVGAAVGAGRVAPLHFCMHSSCEAKLLVLPPLPLYHMIEHPDPV